LGLIEPVTATGYRQAVLTIPELKEELREMETASAVEMDRHVFQEHLSLAMSALGASKFQDLPPLLTARQLRELWRAHEEKDVVTIDGDLFRDILLQALATAPAMH
jgi:hypothetical protein